MEIQTDTKPLTTKGQASFVWALIQPYRKMLLLIFSVMVLETVMGMAAPWPLKILIDHVIGGAPLPKGLQFLQGVFQGSATQSLITIAALSVVLFALLGALAAYANSYLTESVAQYVANDLRKKLYHHLQRLSLSYYATHQIAKIINTITADVSTIQDFASQSIVRMVVDTMTISGMLVVMFYLHWDFALVALALTPFLLLFVIRFKKAIKKATRTVRKEQSQMAAVMQQGLESQRSVNAFGRHDLEEEKMQQASWATVTAALQARRLKAALPLAVSLAVAVCTAFVLYRGTSLVVAGAMTVGALTVFLAYLTKFFLPMQDMAKMTNIIAQSGVALERIQAILSADDIIPEKRNAVTPRGLQGAICFEQVGFCYGDTDAVLQGLTLAIRPGQKIGICGPSGCGKSTIAGLVARFYDVQQGRITIDGVDVRDFSLEGLRSQIGFVLQDTAIFYGTVRDNIVYGKPNATEAEMIEAARAARAHDFIMHMPEGYETIVGERGATLSGGQKQCIGMARALVRQSPILILDEPTASLDAASEKMVMEALESGSAHKTVITIAHRLSTLRHADQIFVLQDGRVAEQGKHEELLQQNGWYASLYRMQAGRENGVFSSNGVADALPVLDA